MLSFGIVWTWVLMCPIIWILLNHGLIPFYFLDCLNFCLFLVHSFFHVLWVSLGSQALYTLYFTCVLPYVLKRWKYSVFNSADFSPKKYLLEDFGVVRVIKVALHYFNIFTDSNEFLFVKLLKHLFANVPFPQILKVGGSVLEVQGTYLGVMSSSSLTLSTILTWFAEHINLS